MFIQEFRSIDSTSLYVKTHLKTLPSEGCIVATTQTGGYGRFGRRWTSPLGGLYMTLFFDWPENKPFPREFSLHVARLVKQILTDHGLAIHLKWPNDLLVGNKKIGGILTEIKENKVIIGIGLNINTTKEDLAEVDQAATSFFIETQRTLSLPPLIKSIFTIINLNVI